jgi:hypothetical protein
MASAMISALRALRGSGIMSASMWFMGCLPAWGRTPMDHAGL